MGAQTIKLKPERLAELEEYAQLHGQSLADALDDLLAAHFSLEREEHEETVQAVLEANEDVKAGRTKPADEVYKAMRLKHGLYGRVHAFSRSRFRRHPWMANQAAGRASRFALEGLQAAVSTLSEMPQRCPTLNDPRLGLEVRQLFYGKKPHVFRILFRVVGETVLVLRIRRGKRVAFKFQ